MVDGSSPFEDDESQSPGSWREAEAVDEQYREPDDTDRFDPGPDVPTAPDPTGNDVDPGVARRFWALVLVFNVALLAISLGLMFVVFEGSYSLGGQLFVAGIAVFGFGLYRYRTAKAYLEENG